MVHSGAIRALAVPPGQKENAMAKALLIGAAAAMVPVAAIATFAFRRGRHHHYDDSTYPPDMESPRDAFGVSPTTG